jgi:hypothetical protein
MVIFSVLMFAGVGSISSKWFYRRNRAYLLIPGFAVTLWVGFQLLFDERLTALVLGLPFIWRIIFSGGMILVLFFFLGMPFPFGIRHVQRGFPELVPWAFGINGCASVGGAILGKLISMTWGFHSVMVIACLLYLLSSALLLKMGRP